MSNKLLYIFAGNNRDFNIMLNQCEDDAVYLIDKDLLNGNEDNIMKFFTSIDFNDYESMEKIIEEICDIKSIVIYPLIDDKKSYDELLLDIGDLLKKVIIICKCIYVIAMRTRKMKIWFVDFASSTEENNEEYVLLESFRQGINSISKVLGMELARKKVVSNYIKVNDKEKLKSVTNLISWALDRDIYLDMQNLMI